MNSPYQDFSNASLHVPTGISGSPAQAVRMLEEEVYTRTHIRLDRKEDLPGSECPCIILLTLDQIDDLPELVQSAASVLGSHPLAGRPEGFHIRLAKVGTQPCLLVIGNDSRGLMYGVGYLLRKLVLRMGHNGSSGSIEVPANIDISTSPAYPLRGHQLGYRAKTNSYDGWDVPQWEQNYRDLIIFGANAIELIPPRSDDDSDSIHFPLPPTQMMVEMSGLADRYNLDVWIWFPAMDEDYGQPETIQSALEEWENIFSRLPRIDAVFVPGGDPGHTRPRDLMTLLEKEKHLLNTYHPQAQMWVSPQGFTTAWMEEFLEFLAYDSPGWLNGVVFGPWVHMSMPDFRQRVPQRYPIRNYPDITHSLDCQFPVPEWDLALALTLGREPINPRPEDQAVIFHHYQPGTIGFLSYSEGCNDDVNKCIWSGLGWNPETPLIDLLRDYGRYFIGADYADNFAQGLLALERNWRGPLIYNSGVYTTLQQFQEMEQCASPQVLKNWRFQQALYRAYYDALTRSRLLYETGLEEQAMDQLRQADKIGALKAANEAERILDEAASRPISTAWRTRLFQLAEALYQSIAMQLDTRLYKGQREVRGANLDAVDYPLNNRPWLKERLAELRQMENEQEQLSAIQAILNYTNPGPGGFFMDLGNSFSWGPVIKGPGFASDPAHLRSAMRRFPYYKDPLPVRYNWRGFTGSLADAPLQLCWENLDPSSAYRVRVVYSPNERRVPLRMDANGIEVHPYLFKEYPSRPQEFDIPRAATQTGKLVLSIAREPGRGRLGAGAEICEIWLLKVSS